MKCGITEALCECGLEEAHEGEHICGLDDCKGSWTYNSDGHMVPVTWPTGGVVADTPMSEVIERLMRLL